MTEKTIKHELYKHGSYLISLKESGSSFVNIDDEIKKLEELFQLASKKDTPPFAVGEYYTSKTGIIFKITSKTAKEEIIAVKSLVDGEIIDGMIDTTEIMFRNSTPATAEQIATFKKAKIKNDIDFIIKDGDGDWIEIVENIQDYLQTDEELQEVGE